MMIFVNANRYPTLLLLIFIFLFTACNDNDNNSSLDSVIYGEKTPVEEKPASDKNNHTEEPDVASLPQSTLILTVSQTNAWKQVFTKFELGLVDIIFSIEPEGLSKTIDIHFNRSNASGIDKAIPLDLTYLEDDQYLLLPLVNLPAGDIKYITFSFSGDQSIIEIPNSTHKGSDLKTYLVDSHFSSYSSGDSQTLGQRKQPAQLTIETDIPLTEDQFQYINIDIDKNMTAGLDPYVFSEKTTQHSITDQYIQFIPTATLTILKKGTHIALVNTSKPTPNIINQTVNIDTISVTETTHTMGMSTSTNEQFAYMTAILSIDTHPTLSSPFIELLDTQEIIERYQNYEKKHAKTKPNKTFLHFRDTLNPQSQTIPGLAMEGVIQEDNKKYEVVFSLPKETHLNQPKAKKTSSNSMDWIVSNLLIYTNPSDMTKPDAQVEALIFPLNNNDKHTDKPFIIVETGNVDINTFKEAPDVIYTFDNINDFYLTFKYKTENDKARILMLNIEGNYKKPIFTAESPIKVILLSTLFEQQINFAVMSWLDAILTKIKEMKALKP